MNIHGVSPLLEGKLRDLYKQHLERSKKIDWGYHDLIPWERGRNFITDPWNPDQVSISPGLYIAVETALLTEVNLPWFTAGLSESFRGSVEVLQEFIRTWTSEEDQHSSVLHNYMLVTRNTDPDRLHHLRKLVVSRAWEPPTNSPFQGLVYVAVQELATRVYYLAVAKQADKEDAVLANILRTIAKDETLHFAFYRDAVQAHLDLNPNYVEQIADVLLGFNMPGLGMPDFDERVRLTAENGIYTLHEYYSQVIDAVMKVWNVKSIMPSALAAKEKLDRLNAYMTRLARMADITERRRQAGKPDKNEARELILAGWHGTV